MKKKWRCTVCGYIHEGDSPPAFCPLCRAGAEQFELVDEIGARPSIAALVKTEFQHLYKGIAPHAIAAHFPAALIPTMTLFATIVIFSGFQPLDFCAFALLIVMAAAVPITMITGLMTWRKDYQGSDTAVFRKKLLLAWALLALGLFVLLWRLWQPDVALAGGLPALLFLLLHLLMLFCVTFLGHYGAVLARAVRK